MVPPSLLFVERARPGVRMVRCPTRLSRRLQRKACFLRFRGFCTRSPAPIPIALPTAATRGLHCLLFPWCVASQGSKKGILALFSGVFPPAPSGLPGFALCLTVL